MRHTNHITENGFHSLKLNILSQQYNNALLNYFSKTETPNKAQQLIHQVFNAVIDEIDLCTQAVNVDAIVFKTAKGLA